MISYQYELALHCPALTFQSISDLVLITAQRKVLPWTHFPTLILSIPWFLSVPLDSMGSAVTLSVHGNISTTSYPKMTSSLKIWQLIFRPRPINPAAKNILARRSRFPWRQLLSNTKAKFCRPNFVSCSWTSWKRKISWAEYIISYWTEDRGDLPRIGERTRVLPPKTRVQISWLRQRLVGKTGKGSFKWKLTRVQAATKNGKYITGGYTP